MSKPVFIRPSSSGFFSIALAVGAALVHLWAGWGDEHRLVLHPVGHLTVFAAMAWLTALAVAVAVIALSERGRKMGFGALVLCGIGILLLFSH